MPTSAGTAWVSWRKLDRFVSTCLKATFTEIISGDVLGLGTSKEIRDFLHTSFRTQYLARKNILRTQLHGIIKGNQSVVVYLQKIKSIDDSSAAIGEKVNDADLMMFVMNGLGPEYDVFVISSQNRETPYSFGELKAKLLSHEQFLSERQHHHTTVYDAQNVTAKHSRNNSNGHNRRNGNGNDGNYRPSQYQHGSS
ncbi:uncharacterized protein LOC113279998 [Papaver somniferum]|uniref:uncharacterized protein LOC113279998 n=1 Tax=Papaver somniferum TaxID=3469 RepID=UPI000E6F600C|nr:uncharacterized protein LOC113279998 [Papaver somniferum]